MAVMKAAWIERKSLFLLTVRHEKKSKQALAAGTGVEAMEEGCSVTCSPSLARFAVFIQARITCPGVAPPTEFLALLETFSH